MKKWLMLYIIMIYLGTLYAVDAYTISRNRVLTPPLPSKVTTSTTLVSVEWQTRINGLKPKGESYAYQSGYQDALKDVRQALGVGGGSFSGKPSYMPIYFNQMMPEFKTCFCYNASYAAALSPVLGNLSRYNITLKMY
jgi:hypothetical protein